MIKPPPAYGRSLYNRRLAGVHPLFVHVIYGEDWSSAKAKRPSAVACVAVSPGRFVADRTDWRCLVGCSVVVVDQVEEAGAQGPQLTDPRGWSRFYRLVHELAQWSGPLSFDTSAELYAYVTPPPKPIRYGVADYARALRDLDPARAWPWWWSDELEREHDVRVRAWYAASYRRAVG